MNQTVPSGWRLIVWVVVFLGSWFVALPFLVVVGCHLWYASRANPGLGQPACQLLGAAALFVLWQVGLALYNVLHERPHMRRCLLMGIVSGRCPECGRPAAA